LFLNAENGNASSNAKAALVEGGIGRGPDGFFFSHFLLDMTRRLAIDVGLATWTRAPALAGGFHSRLHPKGVLEGAKGLPLGLHIYDGRDFSANGPTGCNMYGSTLSESLVTRQGGSITPVQNFHDLPFDSFLFG